jgi:hypothetical protein
MKCACFFGNHINKHYKAITSQKLPIAEGQPTTCAIFMCSGDNARNIFSNAINKLRLHILEDQPQQILSFMFLGSTPTTIGDLDEQTKTSYLLRPTANI